MAIRVFDLGPPARDPERAAWEKANGSGAAEVVTEQPDIIELGRGRYVKVLPDGVSVTNRVQHS